MPENKYPPVGSVWLWGNVKRPPARTTILVICHSRKWMPSLSEHAEIVKICKLSADGSIRIAHWLRSSFGREGIPGSFDDLLRIC